VTVTGIDHLVLSCGDTEAALAFYGGLLALPVDRSNGRCAVRVGRQKINVHRGKAEFLPAAANLAFGSADFCLIAQGDIRDIYEELWAKNTPFALDKDGAPLGILGRTGALGPMESVYLRDPEGNLVEIAVYIPQGSTDLINH
jgi:catechol 2,3-dioxygenase-like lactoylglutathione lyase family enzyme